MTEGNPTPESEMLAAEYVLGLLDHEEIDRFQELLRTDPQARAVYKEWVESFAGIADEISPVSPPPELFERIKAAAFGADAAAKVAKIAAIEDEAERARAARAGAPPKPSWRERLGLLPAMGGGLLAAALALWLINVFVGPMLTPPAATAVLATQDRSLVVELAYAKGGESLRINRTAGDAPEGKALELWLIADGRPPISLGVLPDRSRSTVTLEAGLGPLLWGAQCAISVEPPGGSTTGAPSGEIIAIAPVIWNTG